MTPETAFLRDIALKRFDRLPRLVYADWLEERGDKESTALAEFIRCGCQLAELSEHHKPVTWCDCDQCRLTRRQTELYDGGFTRVLELGGEWEKRGFAGAAFPLANYAGGFPSIFYAADFWPPSSLAKMPAAIGRVFLELPVTSAVVDWWQNPPANGRFRERWRIQVWLKDAANHTPWVFASVGPMVNGNRHETFRCAYPVDHPRRVPTLVRKAVRRCLTNRTSNSEADDITRTPSDGFPLSNPSVARFINPERATA